MVDFPAYVNGVPPVIALRDYDEAEWAKETAVDFNKERGAYVVVNMNDQSQIIATFDKASGVILEDIFNSAKKQYASEHAEIEKR